MRKALVVDDSKTMRIILRRILGEVGYTVLEAEHGLAALHLIEAEGSAVALVLADWNMPEMNGFDLLRSLRRDVRLSALKIVMVTTEAEVNNVQMALAEGANEYVMKPFTKDLLKEKLLMIGALPN